MAENLLEHCRHDRSAAEEIRFSSCKGDPCALIQPALKENRVECYQRVLLFIDDVLDIKEEPERFLLEELEN